MAVVGVMLLTAASATSAQNVNKCMIGGKVTYQTAPCPAVAKTKVVDTRDPNAELGKDFARTAKADKAKLDAAEKAKQQEAARKRAEENGLNPDKLGAQKPQTRNLALERIEAAAEKLRSK